MSKVIDFVKTNKKVIAIVAGGTAAAGVGAYALTKHKVVKEVITPAPTEDTADETDAE